MTTDLLFVMMCLVKKTERDIHIDIIAQSIMISDYF